MRNAYKLIFAAIIACMLSYCSEKPKKTKTYDPGVSLTVQEDVLRAAINRRLIELEKVSFSTAKKQKNRVEIMAPLEPIHQPE